LKTESNAAGESSAFELLRRTRSFLMRKLCLISRALLSLVVACGLAFTILGCDSGPSRSTETKPIEGNILKKLAQSNADQSQEALAKKTARGKTK
jgi:hypothetical protein